MRSFGSYTSGVVVALALFGALLAAPPAQAGTTEFRAQFVCNDRGTLLPLRGMRVEFRQRGLDALHKALTDTVHAVTQADEEGRVAFRHTDSDEDDFYLRPQLSGGGVSLHQFPYPWAFFADTPTNVNDVPTQDYGTQVVPYECEVWEGLTQARRGFDADVGRAPPNGDLTAVVGAPNGGTPLALHTLIIWPRGYDPGAIPGRPTTAFHEFAHTFRHAYDGGLAHFLSDSVRFNYPRNHTACSRTNEGFAFNEGWAEYWAGSYGPAPNCPGIAKSDMRVEGNVAAALTELDRNCENASRRTFVDVLARTGSIHSFAEFRRAFGDCRLILQEAVSAPLEAPGHAKRFGTVLRADGAAIKRRVKTLLGSLDGARTDARGITPADCDDPPCLEEIEKELRPLFLEGEIAAARQIGRALSQQAGTPVPKKLAAGFNRRVAGADEALTRRIGEVGADTLRSALKAAVTLTRDDDSVETAEVVQGLRAALKAFRTAERTGRGLPAGFGALPSATTTLPGRAPEPLSPPAEEPG